MAKSNIWMELSRLSGSLSRLKAHAEWLALKESERRAGEPPALVMDDALAKDIRLETGRFMAVAAEVHEALNHGLTRTSAAGDSVRGRSAARNGVIRNGRTPGARTVWSDELLRLEREFQSLRLPGVPGSTSAAKGL